MNRFLLIAVMLLGICAVLRAVELPPGSVLESNGKCPVAEPQE